MAVRYAVPPIITDGLVLYLDAANRQSYVSGSTTWYDAAGSNISGSLINGPTFSPDNAGSIVFDGVDDYVSVGLDISSFSSITVNLWTYIKSQANIQSRLFSNRPSSTEGLVLWVATSTLNARLNGTLIGLLNSIEINKWLNIVFTWDGSTTTLYVNATQSNTGANTSSTITGASAFVLATGYYDKSTIYMNPLDIATTQIYNRALTASEVLQNYNSTKARFGL